MKQRLTTVDFLRGIAALFVMLYHFTGKGLPKLTIQPLANSFEWGRLGVEIFFVISGFIIPYVLFKSNYKPSNFFKFIGKRMVRIDPPSWIIMILTITQFYFIDRLHLSINAWFGKLTTMQVLCNFTYTIPFTHYDWLNAVFWTLAVELQFYLVLGLVFSFMFKGLKQFIICSMLILSIYYLPISHYATFFYYSSLFIMGGITMMFYIGKASKKQYLSLLPLISILCYFQVGIMETIFGATTSLLIAFAHIKNNAGLFLGKISYSLYLTHILIGSTLETVFIKIIHPTNWEIRLTILILICAATIFLAYLYYRFVELTFLNLSGKLFKKKPTVETAGVIIRTAYEKFKHEKNNNETTKNEL